MHPNRNRYYSTYHNHRHQNGRGINRRSKQNFTKSKRARYLGFVVCFVVAIFGAISIFSGGSHEPTKPAVAATQTKKEYPPVDEQQLSGAINGVIANNTQLDIGVSITDVTTGASYTYGVDKPFIAASVGKMLSAIVYLDEVEHGKRTLEDQLDGGGARNQIQKMVAQSDNDAWHAVNDAIGHPALLVYAKAHGLGSYDPEENKITPREVAKLLTDLYQEKLLSIDNTKFLLANMQQDQEEMQFIRRYVDSNISVYHKAGWLEDRAHDTAIIELGDRPVTLVIFTKARSGVYDFAKGQTVFSQITQATLQRFTL